jgi:bacterioferritin-associated ferredoxin
MYVCICKNITESDLIKDPSLKSQIGTECGMCIDAEEIIDFPLPYTTPET